MNDIDPIFVSALRERAEGAVHVEQLLAASRRRGVRRVRTRRALLTAGAATAVLAVALTATLVPRPHTSPPPSTTTSSAQPPSPSPSASAPPLHRPAVNTSLAPLKGAGKLGEGLQIHLDTVDPAATQLFWTSSEELEAMQVFRGGESSAAPYNAYQVEIRRGDAGFHDSVPDNAKTEDLTVDGRPATLDYTQNMARLRWILYASTDAQVRIQFRDAPVTVETVRASVLEVASWLRIDHVLTCAVPFRLTWAPQGARTDGCGTSTGTGPLPDSAEQTAWIALPVGDSIGITAFPRGATNAVEPNATYAGHPIEKGPDVWKIEIAGRTYGLLPATSRLTDEQLSRILTSIEPAGPTIDPLAR
ncbi:hypothetical protein ACFFX1_49890 [Dactylosporangium sucinum]|uniref:Uncharacterized protein n=1 Tax=Dactylosporangium sucinum TaxID=1424081 RepID=A0A917U848_9ACTN|nr:hypothetical protein [Dactylosporangium sucinum]GGM65645.1 hypothetical protein GCM10007977_079060 [Dactylosporangium sucinum]